MKIAILSFYSGQVSRGAENWTDEFAQRLYGRNHQVDVYQSDTTSSQKTNYAVKVYKVKIDWDKKDSRGTLLRRLFLDYWSLLILKFTLKTLPSLWKGRYDIVIPINGGWQPALVRIMTLMRDSKMVIIGHSGIGWDEKNNLWSFPNLFVALTQKAYQWAKKVNPFVKVTQIANGVDTKKFHPKGDSVDLKLEKPVILSVGALEESKRHDLAIKAVARLKKGSLLILGSGNKQGELEKLGKELLGNRFALRETKYSEIDNYYRSADVFTLASWTNEAFGMVYLEAMAAGLPVVATKDDAREKIIGNAGILIDPNDTKSYSLAISKALEKKWGDRSRKQAEKFAWDKIIREYERKFSDLIN